MNWDDERPKKRAAYELGADLSKLSVKELEAYLDVLAAERARVEGVLQAKKAHESAAHSVFKR